MDDAIYFVCPYCQLTHLETPEALAEHVSCEHDSNADVMYYQFRDYLQFQYWLGHIEDSRSDAGYVRSRESDEPNEYYLLCRRRAQQAAKKRRYSDEVVPGVSNLVSCTAFVHVNESIDGSVSVRYCFEHCGHTDEQDVETSYNVNRLTRKRLHSSSNSSSEVEEVEIEDTPMTETNNNDEKLDDEMDVPSLNSFITQRLDNTADRLKTLTKVLADLAVDIKNCDDPLNRSLVI